LILDAGRERRAGGEDPGRNPVDIGARRARLHEPGARELRAHAAGIVEADEHEPPTGPEGTREIGKPAVAGCPPDQPALTDDHVEAQRREALCSCVGE